TAAPNPRNIASPFSACNSPTNPTGIGSVDPAAAFPGQPILLTAAVTPGNYPVSTGLTILADLSPMGGSSSQFFYDDGTHGDLTAGDLIFSFNAVIDGAALPGIKAIAILVRDEQNRTGSASMPFVVAPELSGIHDVQGAGHLSPLANTLVSVQGVTTAKRANGFYLQDPNPDDNAATSEGIFIFTGAVPNVAVGDLLLVTGTVKEYRASGVTSVYLTNTELENPGFTLTLLSRNHPLPSPVVLGSGGRIPPATVIEDDATGDVETSGLFDPAEDGLDFYESLEAMLVQMNDTVAVGPIKNFGSNRELPVVGDNGIHAGLFSSRGALVVRPDDFNPERLILNDLILGGPTLPSADQGDKFPGSLLGVLDYSYGNYKLELIALPALVPGGLAQEMLNDPGKYDLSVATFNVENLAPNNPPAKFAALADLIVNHLKSPDLLGIEEIQDNSGAKDDGTVDATLTWNKLIAAVQAAGGPNYAYRQIDPVNDEDGGAEGGNIRVGFLFRMDRGLSFIDRPGANALTPNAVGTGATGPELQYSPGRLDPANPAFLNSRKPLAGEFLCRGSKLFVILNHFNSKGGDTPLAGRFQPPILNSEVQRLQQAAVVKGFVQSILNIDPNANVIVLGDLNDFQFSKPLQTLKSAPLYNLIETLPEAERYSYVYEGNAQALDHILFSEGLANRPLAYGVVHVNSEFAAQVSDHDPQAVYVTFNDPPVVIPGGPYTVSEGNIVMLSAAAVDPEGGLLSYAWDLDQDNVFETSGQTVAYTALDGPSSLTLRVQVTDDGGLSTLASVLITIQNSAPAIGPIQAPAAPVSIHQPVKVSASFEDPGIRDTHKAEWNWGDGRTSPGVIVELNGAGTVSGKHIYKSPGLYKVTLTVTDQDGASARAFYEYVVVYNPHSFTSGSGWIQSPLGAFPADPAATGYAGFHFTVKNKKHSGNTEGRVEFRLKSGNLHFQATDFTWLVADWSRARVKGAGTINGQGTCFFNLEVMESRRHHPPTFHIKIWQDLNGAEQIVYDNKTLQPVFFGYILIR
ncbi:MAG: PKD domain-containing protein, partial [Desulfobacteraceae bacterium]